MSELSFTTIEEPARKALDISRDEYALCNYIQTWAGYPKNRVAGYCDRTRKQMAEFIGISERGVMKMLDRMEASGLVERYDNRFLHRISLRWFEVVTLAKSERKEEQSSPEKAKKVLPKEEQSSPFGANKVLPHKEYYKEHKEIYKKEENNAGASDLLTPPFKKIGEIEIELHDPEIPGCIVRDMVAVEEHSKKGKASPGRGAKSEKQPRQKREIAPASIHPENEQHFQHFSDPNKARAAWMQWLRYKVEQFREKYKSPESEAIKLRQLWQETKGDSVILERNISFSMGSLYKGIFPPKDSRPKQPAPNPNRVSLNSAGGDYSKYLEKQIF